MGKGNAFMGTLRGKIGDVVFSRRLGQQVSRAYVKTEQNAPTRGQVSQQSRLGNIVTSYRAYRTLLRRAFESRKEGQTDYNVFASINLPTSQVYLSSQATSAGACVVAPYAVTRGVLPTVEVTEQVAGTFTSDIAVPAGFVLDDTISVAALTTAILAANQDWIEGDQLTIVHASQYVQPNTGYPMATVRLYDMVLSLTDATPVYDRIPASALEIIGGFLGMQNPQFVGGVTVIHSRRLPAGSLTVSTQRILLTRSNNIYAQYSGVSAEASAVATRGFTESPYLDPTSDYGQAGSPVVPGGAAQITGMTIRGVNVLTAANFVPANNDTVVISGVNLSAETVQLETESAPLASISTFLTNPTVSGTRISGLWAGGSVELLQLVAAGNVAKAWEPDEYIDPNA